MKQTIKKGDRVRCVGNYEDQFTAGKIYTANAGCTKNAVTVISDDRGVPNGWLSKYFELVRRGRDAKAKVKSDSQKCSFKDLNIEPPMFFELMVLLGGLEWTQRKNLNGAFVFGFSGGRIITTICPLTGCTLDGGTSMISDAGDVGIEGTRAFVTKVTQFLKDHGSYSELIKGSRRFV